MTDWKPEIRRHLARLQLETTREAEILEELAQHLEDRYEELLTCDATEDEASRVALAELSDNQWLAQGFEGQDEGCLRERLKTYQHFAQFLLLK